jgi:hypothetical protein
MWQDLDDSTESDQAKEEALLGRSLLKSAAAGLVVTVILIAALAPLAWYLPLLALGWLLRAVIAFAVAWVLFSVVHRAAGMVGWPFSILVGVLTTLVMVSHHVAFALHGVPSRSGTVSGWEWLTPLALLVVNIPTLIGAGGCIWLRHDGGANWETIIDILRLR